jgi:uncharacterized protein YegL
MKENLTEIVAILDRSGSMEELTGDTIGGYNSFIKGQKEVPGEAFLTTVLFDDQYELLHDRVDIKKVKNLTKKQYWARGTTALLDALGKTINDIGLKLYNTPEHERPSKVIFFIITDGLENASHEFTDDKIKQMVELQRNTYSWEFIFLGANMDAFSVATSMGIRGDMAFDMDNDGATFRNAYNWMADAVVSYRKVGKVGDKAIAELKSLKKGKK